MLFNTKYARYSMFLVSLVELLAKEEWAMELIAVIC